MLAREYKPAEGAALGIQGLSKTITAPSVGYAATFGALRAQTVMRSTDLYRILVMVA